MPRPPKKAGRPKKEESSGAGDFAPAPASESTRTPATEPSGEVVVAAPPTPAPAPGPKPAKDVIVANTIHISRLQALSMVDLNSMAKPSHKRLCQFA